MAVTLTVQEFIADARIGATAEELDLAQRRLDYAAVAVVKYAPDAPNEVHNQAASMLASYLYDQPTASVGTAFANAMRSSGASRVLLPYRIHRVGLAEGIGIANEALGTIGNPVISLVIVGEVLRVTYADGALEDLDLPAGGGGEDQEARDSAQTAQERADDAFTNAATAQASADANTANVATNADALTALPTPVDWARTGNTDLIPGTKISSTIRGTKVHVRTDFPDAANLGDILIHDLTTISPSIYEWGTQGWQLDYTFQGGRIHIVTEAHDVALNSPSANGGDVLLSLVAGTLTMYKRLNAASTPFWQLVGEVMGGSGGGGQPVSSGGALTLTNIATGTLDGSRTLFSFTQAGTDAMVDAWETGGISALVLGFKNTATAGTTDRRVVRFARVEALGVNPDQFHFDFGAWANLADFDCRFQLFKSTTNSAIITITSGQTFPTGEEVTVFSETGGGGGGGGGMFSGTDSTARRAAATNATGLAAHEASTHNTDIVAQSTALNARQTADQAQTAVEAHRNSTHNTDGTARTSAGAAQTTANTARTELTAHESTPHGGGGGAGVDQTARDSAAAAQAEITAHDGSTHNTDTTARSTARNARQTAEQAQTGLEAHEGSTHNTDAGARTGAANAQRAIEDHGRLPHNTDQTARDAAAAAQAAADAAGGGQPPTVLYEAATATIDGSTGLIAGNVVCPATGTLEFYFRQVTGDRQGSIAYARIPAADVRAAVEALAVGYNNDNVNVRILALGANRGVSIAVQATTFYLMLNAQSAGTFSTRITHTA